MFLNCIVQKTIPMKLHGSFDPDACEPRYRTSAASALVVQATSKTLEAGLGDWLLVNAQGLSMEGFAGTSNTSALPAARVLPASLEVAERRIALLRARMEKSA